MASVIMSISRCAAFWRPSSSARCSGSMGAVWIEARSMDMVLMAASRSEATRRGALVLTEHNATFAVEHSPTRVDEYAARLCPPPVHVVYDHPDMFDAPANMLHVFCADGKGGWKLDDESLRRADEVGCGVGSTMSSSSGDGDGDGDGDGSAGEAQR